MVMECNLSHQNPITIICITANRLPAMSIRGVILGFGQSLELCCDILLNFALVTAQRCAVCMAMYRDSAIALCTMQITRQLPVAACTNLAPNIHTLKPDLRLTDTRVELSKSSEQSLTSFSEFEFKNRQCRSGDIRKAIYHVKTHRPYLHATKLCYHPFKSRSDQQYSLISLGQKSLFLRTYVIIALNWGLVIEFLVKRKSSATHIKIGWFPSILTDFLTTP